jgi:hypothetical protein
MNGGREERMRTVIVTAIRDRVAPGMQAEDAPSVTEEGAYDPKKSLAQKILERELPFVEGRPWSPPAPDLSLAELEEQLRRAEDLEKEIADIENEEEEF